MRRLSPKYIRSHKVREAKYLSKPREPKEKINRAKTPETTIVHTEPGSFPLLLFLQLKQEIVDVSMLPDQLQREAPEPVEDEHGDEEDPQSIQRNFIQDPFLSDE